MIYPVVLFLTSPVEGGRRLKELRSRSVGAMVVPCWNFEMYKGSMECFGFRRRRFVGSLVEKGLSTRGGSMFTDVKRLIAVGTTSSE